MFDHHISINYCLYLLTVQKDRDTFLSTLLKHMTQKLTGIFYINEIPDFKGVFFSSKFTIRNILSLNLNQILLKFHSTTVSILDMNIIHYRYNKNATL